ncbi:DUF5337 domain-containing protein [Planktomarina sp.]|nr:DUF5337 domain-containing protein [Planktomarina sp.]MDA9271432.1 DUF5337 domain-containing protein [Planktomarina sp.]MDB4051320.1 DUF5337 domain-containing protein [Planktomarina sp.]
MSGKQDHIQSKKGRLAGLVIAGSMLLWLGLQWLATELNLSVRLMLLIDFVVIAAMAWSLLITFQIWRARHHSERNSPKC